MKDDVFLSLFVFTCQDCAVAAAKDTERHSEATSYCCEGALRD